MLSSLFWGRLQLAISQIDLQGVLDTPFYQYTRPQFISAPDLVNIPITGMSNQPNMGMCIDVAQFAQIKHIL